MQRILYLNPQKEKEILAGMDLIFQKINQIRSNRKISRKAGKTDSL